MVLLDFIQEGEEKMNYRFYVFFGFFCYITGAIFSFTDIEAGHRMFQLATTFFVLAIFIKGEEDD